MFTTDNFYSGGTRINAGTVQLETALGLGFGTVALDERRRPGRRGDALDVANNFNLTPAGGTIDTSSFSLTLSGIIADNGGPGVLTKNGTGTLILSAANTYSGGTVLNSGTLRLENSLSLGTGRLTVNGSVVDYADGVNIANPVVIQSDTTQFQVLAGTATQSGAVSEDASPRPLEKIGDGTLIVMSLTNTGATTVTGGTLQGGGLLAFSGASNYTVATGATLDLGGFSQRVNSLAGDGTVTNSEFAQATLIVGTSGVSTENTTFFGVIQDGNAPLRLEIATSGNLTLSGYNTYTGGTVLDATQVTITNGNALGSSARDRHPIEHAAEHRQPDTG